MKHLKFIKDQLRARVSKPFYTTISTYEGLGTYLEIKNSDGQPVEGLKLRDDSGNPVDRGFLERIIGRVIKNLKKHL